MIRRSGYDRRKHPALYRVRYWTEEEILSPNFLQGSARTIWFEANDHTIRQLRLNGAIKQWKTDRRRIEVPVKYGLRECARWTLEDCVRRFVHLEAVKEPADDWKPV